MDVMNGADERHSFAVTVAGVDGETLFDREYDLEAGTGDENRVVEGVPESVTVVRDGEERTEFPWAPAGEAPDCEGDTSTGITLYYAKGSADEVTATYECETVREGGSRDG